METVKNAALTFTHFVWKVLLVESALLIVITILWRLTTWHITANYGFALFTAGGIMVAAGLVGIARRGSSADSKLVEMRNRDHKGQRRFIYSYAESTRVMRWFIGLGLVTVAIGTVFGAFFP